MNKYVIIFFLSIFMITSYSQDFDKKEIKKLSKFGIDFKKYSIKDCENKFQYKMILIHNKQEKASLTHAVIITSIFSAPIIVGTTIVLT